MAAWTQEQMVRLAWEENLLAQELPHFSFQDRASGGLTTVRGTHTSSGNGVYGISVWLKEGFPYLMPELYITYPCPLVGYAGRSIQSYGTSHAMHVWGSDWNNYVKICHCKSEYWSASNTVLSVLLKGFLWIEAFESHRRTGQSIDAYSLTYE